MTEVGEILEEHANVEDGITGRVVQAAKGFAVVLRDDDSGNTLPMGKVVPTREEARGLARKWAGITD